MRARVIFIVGLWLLLAAGSAHSAHKIQARLIFTGMCDASGGAAVGTNLIAVADDENNVLRVYRADIGGAPVNQIDVSTFVGAIGKTAETDLEGAAWVGDKIFWIGSHSRNKDGKYREHRHVLFATTVEPDGATARLKPTGRCYRDLLLDFIEDPRLRPFNLLAASTRAPKTPEALNIEGLSATPEGALLIGFRNPIPGKQALIVPLLNPDGILGGQRARLGDPILLDLGGLGVRDMGLRGSVYYILAGPFDHEKKFRLYTWDGKDKKPKVVHDLDFPKHFTPEALIFHPGREDFQILSDDGTLKIQGIDCKQAPLDQRRFCGAWVLPGAEAKAGKGARGGLGP